MKLSEVPNLILRIREKLAFLLVIPESKVSLEHFQYTRGEQLVVSFRLLDVPSELELSKDYFTPICIRYGLRVSGLFGTADVGAWDIIFVKDC